MGFPLDQYEHLMLAILCWSYFHDLDFVSWFQWRNRAASDTAGSKREVHGVGEIVIPTHRLFFRAIGIHNNFHVDPLFTFFITISSDNSLTCLLAEIGISKIVAPFSTASSAMFAALYTGCRISVQ